MTVSKTQDSKLLGTLFIYQQTPVANQGMVFFAILFSQLRSRARYVHELSDVMKQFPATDSWNIDDLEKPRQTVTTAYFW